MILKIVKVKDDSFDSDGGDRIEYYRVYGEKTDGTLLVFGSKTNYEAKVGETLDLLIEGRPDKNGKLRYYELAD